MEKDQSHRSCEKWKSNTKNQGGGKYPYAVQGKKGNWIGHIFRRKCPMKHAIEGKTEGRMDVTGRQGRGHKHLLDDLQ